METRDNFKPTSNSDATGPRKDVMAAFSSGVGRWRRRFPASSPSSIGSRSPRRFALMGAALISAIVIGDLLIISMEREASIAAYLVAGANLTRGMTAQTSTMLAAVDKTLRDTPTSLNLGSLTPSQVKSALRSQTASRLLADEQKRLPILESLFLVDADGQVAGSSKTSPDTRIDFSTQEFFSRVRDWDDGDPFISAPTVDAEGEPQTVYIARRMSDFHGEFAGVVVAQVSITKLTDFYKVAMPAHRTITLMKSDGAVLLRYPPRSDRRGQTVADLKSIEMDAKGCAPLHGPDLVDRTLVVAMICRMPHFPLLIQTSSAEVEVLADWRQERSWLAIGGVLASMGVIWLLRTFARQVRRLEASESSLSAKNLQVEMGRQQLHLALANIPQGVCFFDGDHRLIVSNQRYLEIYDLPPQYGETGTTLAEIIAKRSKGAEIKNTTGEEYLASMELVARERKPQQSVIELADGRSVAIQSRPMRDGGWVATHEDITARRQAEQKIAFLAKHDALTGLPNRSQLQERISQAIEDASRGGRFNVLFLDLDRFKAVNDTLGHDAGDELLRQVAKRLTSAVRQGDMVARLGGDEFVVLQSGVKAPEEAAQLARRIVELLAAPFNIFGQDVFIGGSVGIEVSNGKPATAEALLKNADTALYLAKAQGRGCFRFFESEMDSDLRQRQTLESELRQAVSDQQFELHYQPIVDAASGRVVAAEALLRWRHPKRGIVPPGEFIALAEECGLIVPIGEWTIQQACRQAAGWPEDIRVAVNLSPVQFGAADLFPVIREALEATGLAPDRLELEVTEAILLQSDDRNLNILHRLREVGVKIVMDDLGAGYSSLRHLKKFPFDKVKIDRSFVRDLTSQKDEVYFVRAIVRLCRDLGINITAKGVETAEQLSILLQEGCPELQGYIFGRPQPAATIEPMFGVDCPVTRMAEPWGPLRRAANA